MPDYREVNRKREMAEDLIKSLVDMDLGTASSKGFSVEEAVTNVGLDAIHFIWAENALYAQDSGYGDHISDYSEGWLAELLNYVVDCWVATGKVQRTQALMDYGLL